MRLSLLARKLNVIPSEISEELQEEGEKPLHGNSKLTEPQIEKILRLYGPLPEEEPLEATPSAGAAEKIPEKEVQTSSEPIAIAEELAEVGGTSKFDIEEEEITIPEEVTSTIVAHDEKDEETVAEIPEVKDLPREPVIEESVAEPIEQEVATIDVIAEMDKVALAEEGADHPETEEAENAQESESSTKLEIHVSELLEDPDMALLDNPDVLIKAPKVYLPGLKVKGKIELPEPKPKPEKETTEDESSDRRGKHREKRRRTTNPVATARMREERKAERRKKAELAREKERKKHHYQKNIQSKTAPPPKKKVEKKPHVAQQPTARPQAPEKLNALQRFWRWMNT